MTLIYIRERGYAAKGYSRYLLWLAIVGGTKAVTKVWLSRDRVDGSMVIFNHVQNVRRKRPSVRLA